MPHYELTRDELDELLRPVKGVGGFEGLIRRLQAQVNYATSEIKLNDKDLDDVQRYAFDYKQGGFEHRLLKIFGRVLGPRLGREEPKDGDERDCEQCGEPAIFETKPLKPSAQPFQVGDHVPPAAEYQAGPGWTCTVCRHFELLEQ
jgi:hypothetical protein